MRRLTALSAIALGLSSLSLAGCMTATRGTSADFYILTEPPGAKVVTNLETKESKQARKADPSLEPVFHGCAATPCEMNVSRRSNFIAWIEKEGYKRTAACIESNVQLAPTAASLSQAAAGIGTGQAVVATSTISTIPGFIGTAMWASAAVGAGITSATVDTATGAILGPSPNPLAVELMPIGEDAPAIRHRVSNQVDRATINQPDAHTIEVRKNEYERAQRCVAKLQEIDGNS